jgi:hypothetical protein
MFVPRRQILKLSACALTAAVPGSPLILTPSHSGTQAAAAAEEAEGQSREGFLKRIASEPTSSLPE